VEAMQLPQQNYCESNRHTEHHHPKNDFVIVAV